MYALQPVPITAGKIISSNAVEQHDEWDIGDTYAKGERAVIESELSEYESLADANTGNDPRTTLGSKWLRSGPSNKGAMFDKSVSTMTTATNDLTVVVAPGVVTNALGFVNLQGAMLDVTVRDGSGGDVVYQRSESLDGSIVLDWYGYFFAPFNARTEVVMTDVPPYASAHIEAKVTGGGAVGVGVMIVGNIHEIGWTQYDAAFGINDYSQLEEDRWGNATFAEGTTYSRNMDLQVMVKNVRLHYVARLLAQLRQTPTLWIGSQDPRYQPLIVFGFVRSWRAAIPYPNESLIDLQIKGMNDVI